MHGPQNIKPVERQIVSQLRL